MPDDVAVVPNMFGSPTDDITLTELFIDFSITNLLGPETPELIRKLGFIRFRVSIYDEYDANNASAINAKNLKIILTPIL